MATSVDFLDYDGLKEFDAQNKINYRKAIEDEAVKITASIGNIGLLTTDNKENLVNAVNELHNKISDNGGSSSSGSLVIEEQDEEGYYKVYSFKQNNNEIGKIKLFNNEILQSGFVYKKSGKIYLKLVYLINGVTEKEVLIDVSSIAGSGGSGGGGGTNFTPQENPLEIQLTLEDDILSATIVNGSITSEKLATQIINTEHIVDNAVITNKIVDSAITTDKIADNAITFEKLDAGSVQQGLGNPIPVNADIQIVSYENYLQLIENDLVDETTFYCIPY